MLSDEEIVQYFSRKLSEDCRNQKNSVSLFAQGRANCGERDELLTRKTDENRPSVIPHPEVL